MLEMPCCKFCLSRTLSMGSMGNPGERHLSAKTGSASAGATLMFVLALGFGLLINHSAQAQTLHVLYNFAGSSDGGDPYASLIRDAAGNLYSTFGYGGGTSFSGGVFKVAADGTETVLYSFTGGADGAFPISALVRDRAGNLYGTTTQGGSAGAGVVFKLDASGTETVLHNFTGGKDGVDPVGGLLRDKAGNLYGRTSLGCSSNGVTEEGGSSGGGILYKLSKSGKLTILHSFTGGTTDGCNVLGAPFLDAAGNFYGTTSSCGTNKLGTVWEVSKSGKEKVLHSFAGGTSDGEYPLAGVIVDAEGNVYGTTETGGASNVGTVYRVSKGGKFTLLHSFNGTDGKYAYCGL